MSTQNQPVAQKDPEKAHFDANAYLEYFTSINEHFKVSAEEMIAKFIELLNLVFAEHEFKEHENTAGEGVKERTLLDVGTGRRVWHLGVASKKYDRLTLTDPISDHLYILQNFSTSIDQEPLLGCFETAARYEQDAKCNEIGERIRAKISKVCRLDILGEPILDARLQAQQFDCVLSVLFLEVACTHEENHERALKKMLSLVKRGGRLVVAGALNEEYFVHRAGQPMSSCPVLSTMVVAWLERQKCVVTKKCTEYFHSPMDGLGCYVIDAIKTVD